MTELALTDHVPRPNPSQRGSRRMERFEAQYWSSNSFDETMVLLNDVVQVFGLDNPDDPANAGELEDEVETFQTCKIGSTLVDGDALWDTVGTDDTFENRLAAAVSGFSDRMKSRI